MPIDPVLLRKLAGYPFSELDRLKKLLSAADLTTSIHPSITQMAKLHTALNRFDLSSLRGVLAEHTHQTGFEADQLRLAVGDSQSFRSTVAAAGEFQSFAAPEAMFRSPLYATALSDDFPDALKQQRLLDESMRAITGTSYHEAALRSADLANQFRLPGILEAYRIGTDMFADRLAVAGLTGSLVPGRWKDPGFLSAFSGAAAMANAMSSASMMNADIQEMIRSLAGAGIPADLDVKTYRSVLDAAGLILPRWPVIRRLSQKELAERREKKLRKHRQPTHVGRAKSLVHQYERYLREAIDDLMTSEYGDGWPDERLSACAEDPDWRGDARRLLSIWKRDGGNVLDHADYVHYRMIMIQDDHFRDLFSFGFGDDPGILVDLIDRARRLRAASHHARDDFTPRDLQDLRLTWRAITLGLESLTSGIEMTFAVT